MNNLVHDSLPIPGSFSGLIMFGVGLGTRTLRAPCAAHCSLAPRPIIEHWREVQVATLLVKGLHAAQVEYLYATLQLEVVAVSVQHMQHALFGGALNLR